MTSNLTPASEFPPGSAVWVCDLTAAGRTSLDLFLIKHARHYGGHPTELERWITQGVLDGLAESIKRGQTIGYVLRGDASKDGMEHTFNPAAVDVLCEPMPQFE
jgi:hypothetical protein